MISLFNQLLHIKVKTDFWGTCLHFYIQPCILKSFDKTEGSLWFWSKEEKAIIKLPCAPRSGRVFF